MNHCDYTRDEYKTANTTPPTPTAHDAQQLALDARDRVVKARAFWVMRNGRYTLTRRDGATIASLSLAAWNERGGRTLTHVLTSLPIDAAADALSAPIVEWPEGQR